MNEKEEAIIKLNNYFKKNCLVEGYEVALRTANIDFSSDENIKNLVNSFFLIYNSGKGTAMQLFNIVRGIAIFIGDDIEVKELDKLMIKNNKLPSVSIVEVLLEKYLRVGYKLDKRVAFGKREHSLAELNDYLQVKKTAIFGIFVCILKENNIQVPFTIPNFGNIADDLGDL